MSRPDPKYPVLRWRSGAVSIAAGSSWLTIRAGSQTVRIEKARFHVLRHYLLRSGDWNLRGIGTPFTRVAPDLPLSIGVEDGTAAIKLGSSSEGYRCPLAPLLDLASWLNFVETGIPAIIEADRHLHLRHLGPNTYSPASAVVEMAYGKESLRLCSEEPVALAEFLLAVAADNSSQEHWLDIANAGRVSIYRAGGSPLYFFTYCDGDLELTSRYIQQTTMVITALDLLSGRP